MKTYTVPKITYRANDWWDSENNRILYGIDARSDGKWHHAAENGTPLLFEIPAYREAKMKELRKAARDAARLPQP